MFHTIADFITIWQEEAKKTDHLFSALTDEVLNKTLVPGYRTIGKIAWHLLESPKEMLGRTGLHVEGPEAHSTPPKTVKELKDEHHKVASSVAKEIQKHWNNKTLHETDDMYGEQWTRSQTLMALLFHLIHHRGQITTLMRFAGAKVPGMYGPAKEEWAQYGLPAQE